MKTSELIGPALDWAVSECEGYFDIDMAVVRNGEVRVHYFDKWAPSTDWAQGGPLIEREQIDLVWQASGEEEWSAYPNVGMNDEFVQRGPTPLIAAMRCFVASRHGDEVSVPAEFQEAA